MTTKPPNTDHLILKEPLSEQLLAQHASVTKVSITGARFSQHDLRSLRLLPKLTSVRIVGGSFSLESLRDVSNLRELLLDDPHTLDGLDSLKPLTALSIYCLPKIRSLHPLGALENLETLLISTPPGYDVSRKCHHVESLKPLRRLKNLRRLTMRGILPDDETLTPLYGLTQLKTLEITHVYTFALEDFARLARALPNTTGHCLVPYFTASWTGVCSKCGIPRVALTAPPPRSPRMACPSCHADRLRQHEARWNEIAG